MTVNAIDHRCIRAELTAAELLGYHISPEKMELDDHATRVMVSDILTLIEHMGLRRFGDRVTVECHPCPEGGCGMLFTVEPALKWLFESADDILFALRAGVLPRQPCSLTPEGEGYLLTTKYQLLPEESAALSEFCQPVSDGQ